MATAIISRATACSRRANRLAFPLLARPSGIIVQETAFSTPLLAAVTTDPKSVMERLSGSSYSVRAVEIEADMDLPHAIVFVGRDGTAKIGKIFENKRLADAFLEYYNPASGGMGIAVPFAWPI